jgi:hypothetical protein
MTDINPPGMPLGGLSKPRLRIRVNGTQINGAVSASVTSNNYYRADEWTATVIPDQDSVWTLDKWLPAGGNPPDAMVEIVAYDEIAGGTGNTLIVGKADTRDWDPLTGCLDIGGRDLTAVLIEAKTFDTYMAQTASQVAQALFEKHRADGFTAAQITPTTELVQRLYKIDNTKTSHDAFSRATTEWDLLTSLAQYEGFDVFVKGTTLYFQPATTATGSPWAIWVDRTKNPITANCENLRFAHNDMAKDVLVRLRTWNSRLGTGFEVTAPPGVSSSAIKSGKATQYVYRRPNLDRDQAQKLANSIYSDLVRHQVKVTASWPYMTGLTARDILRVQGVGAGLDGKYFFTEIERTIDFQGGYGEHVTACNQQPALTAEVG